MISSINLFISIVIVLIIFTTSLVFALLKSASRDTDIIHEEFVEYLKIKK